MREKGSLFFEREGEPIKIERITSRDIEPRLPAPNETVMVLQRNAKDMREPGNDFGALEKEAVEKTRAEAKLFFERLFSELPEDERETIDVMIVASDATLLTPDGQLCEHRRAVETAEIIIQALKESMKQFNIPEDSFLNITGSNGEPIAVSELRDLLMFEESPEFVKYMTEKYGTGKEFWVAYETDAEKEKRIEMGVEGLKEIADRVNYALTVRARIAAEHHKTNPGRRLVIWNVSHYDAISPFIKEHIAGVDVTDYLPVEHSGGITIQIDDKGQPHATIKNQEVTFKKKTL